MAVRAVHFDLRAQRKRHVIADRAEAHDLRFRARLLRAELVARKADHREALSLQLAIQALQPGVLRRVAALARDVDDQRDAAAQRREQIGHAVDALHAKL